MTETQKNKIGTWPTILTGLVIIIVIGVVTQSLAATDKEKSILNILTGGTSDEVITVKDPDKFLLANRIAPVLNEDSGILVGCSYTYKDFNMEFQSVPNTFIAYDEESGRGFAPYVATTNATSCTDLTNEKLKGKKLRKLEGKVIPFTLEGSPEKTLDVLLTSRGSSLEKCQINQSEDQNGQQVFTLTLKNPNSTDNCTQFSDGFNGLESKFFYNPTLVPNTLLYVRTNPENRFYTEGSIKVVANEASL